MKPAGILYFSLITLAGCVTTNWQHTSIADSSAADRQFKADDTYCTLAANGSVPMPPIATAPPAATFTTGQVNVRNTATGETAYGNYSATTLPSGGFAAGMANGMASGIALGASIRASQERERAHAACMHIKGWVEAETGASRAAPPEAHKRDNPTETARLGTGQDAPINATAISGTTFPSATSDEVILTCRVGSAHGTAEAPGEQFDYQMRIAGSKVWHGLFKKTLPLSTSENEYRWQVPLSVLKPTDTSNVVVKGSINRYSGAYTEVLVGDKGIAPWSKGECKKLQRAF